MSENVGQRRVNHSVEYFDALYYQVENDDNIKHRNIPEKHLVFFAGCFQT